MCLSSLVGKRCYGNDKGVKCQFNTAPVSLLLLWDTAVVRTKQITLTVNMDLINKLQPLVSFHDNTTQESDDNLLLLLLFSKSQREN